MQTDRFMIKGEKNLKIAGLKIQIENIQDVADRALKAFNEPDLHVQISYVPRGLERTLYEERLANKNDREALQLICEQAISTRINLENQLAELQKEKE